VWILVANSWMHTPAGFRIVGEGSNARAEITDFWAMVFNPSSVDRLFHTLCGAWQAGAFLVASVGAWYLLRRRHLDFARGSLRVALPTALIASLLQLVSGHISAQGVAKNQPVKLAAFEGLYDTASNAPLRLFGWVDERNERVIGPAIPRLLSLLAHNDVSKPVAGLRQLAPDPQDRPPVNLTFQFFHVMVAVGFGLILVSVLGSYHFWRGSIDDKKWVLWLLVLSVLGPHVANQAGWFAAEVGRQPWIVQGYLRTSEAVSPVLRAHEVLGSLILFGLIYLVLFAVFIYLLNEKIQHGPDEADLKPNGKMAA
ncbi:MAG: cytochrome ubiquinol oxidase subunit I, partial [Verrucomicrobiae bacterium]|nr:cytochrome ubiquinol oxidase subunit I [Verrucomicrobiae bacterium]